MPNFSSLAGQEVAEKFVVVGGGVVEHVATMSNSNVSCFRVVLVELRWVLTILFLMYKRRV